MSSASAKIILFGEHAVVYGQPAIAVPVSSLRAYAEIEAQATHFQIVARDLHDKIIRFDGDDPLAQVVRLTLEALNVPIPDVSIAVRSDIPIASGLGSGAAISTAIIRTLVDIFDGELPNDAINQIVYEVEKIHHGTPSGIDNTVIVYEQAIYFVRERPIELIETVTPLEIVVADTGQAALTKVAVGDVRRLYEASQDSIAPIIHEIGAITKNARIAMQNGDKKLLGDLMLKNHTLLQKLTVSSPELDKLVDVAMNAGAIGSKLSGGGRGGNMIALIDGNAETVMEALMEAGASHVFKTTVEKN